MSSPDLEALYRQIEALSPRPLSLMEVCGTHTMAISRFGIRSRIPKALRLISGPGCPVCVTPCQTIDQAVAMAREPGVVVVSFGDMMRVPGSHSSLERERADGRDVRLVYSPFDSLRMAREEPEKTFVFVGVGFETTSPTVAATIVRAVDEGLRNFCVLPAFKLVPPAMQALIAGSDRQRPRIDGFICPGHVSAIIGSTPYEPIAQLGIPCVITGFEGHDILEGILMLLRQLDSGRAQVEIEYKRAVPPDGNPTAKALLDRVFQPCDAQWRGIGSIPATGLALSPSLTAADARIRVPVAVDTRIDLPEGCSCGEVMRGLLLPPECPLFATACTPARPVGPCMVSSEGACAAYLRYGG